MRLPALAAQLQGFAHSPSCAYVGVSLRKTITIPASIGSLIPTYLLPTWCMMGTGSTIVAGSSL